MSSIPNSAMPHKFVDEDDEEFGDARTPTDMPAPSAALLIGGAVAAYVLYRIFR